MNGNPARLTELPELDFICTVNPKRKKDLKAMNPWLKYTWSDTP